MNSIPIQRLPAATASCLLATLFLTGCIAIGREPGLPAQPTETTRPATPTPTPVPLITVENLTVKAGDQEHHWEVFGTIQNISDDGLTDLELSVTALGPEGEVQAQGTFLPALRQLSPGDTTAFKAEFEQIGLDLQPERILVQLASFRVSTITPLQISVDQISARPNFEGGTTYLGYFSNVQLRYGEFRNIEAFMVNEDGEPIDSADFILTTTSIAPRGQVPFLVEFFEDYDEAWPEFYIDAIPSEEPDGASPLWVVTEPRLFFTSQSIPYYLIEIKNTAFAPQKIEGILTLSEGLELLGILPIRSPIPIPAQSSWYFTLEPSLAIPVQIRDDEAALSDLIADVALDPLKTRGVSVEIVDLELEIVKIETIGGSIYLQGKMTNPTEQKIEHPAAFALLHTTSGEVISANSERAADTILAGETVQFTLPLRIPAGTDPSALEFDLSAMGVTP